MEIKKFLPIETNNRINTFSTLATSHFDQSTYMGTSTLVCKQKKTYETVKQHLRAKFSKISYVPRLSSAAIKNYSNIWMVKKNLYAS